LKLARVGTVGNEIPVLIDSENVIRSLVGVIDDEAESAFSPRALDMLGQLNIESFSIVTSPERYRPCVKSPSQVICVGLNHAQHAKKIWDRDPQSTNLIYEIAKLDLRCY
jgi:2,4-diketo-3-deoxy-L-fuconate hydrolase